MTEFQESVDALSTIFGGGGDNPVGTVEETEEIVGTEDELEPDEATDEAITDGDPDEELDDPDGEPGEEPDDEGDKALHKVRVAGEEVEVTYDELLAGYSRHGDYQRKTAALAEERRGFESEREAITQERGQYAQGLGQLAQLLEVATRGQEPDRSLLDTDPVAYQRQKLAYDDKRAQVEAVKAEQARVAQLQQAEANQRTQAYREEQHQMLLSAVPEWQDDGVRKKEVGELVDYLQAQGVPPEAIQGLSHHLDFVLGRKAMLFDRLKAKGRETAKKKVRSAKPGAGDAKGEVESRRQRQTRERFRKTGSLDDAASLIRDIMR